MFGNVFRVFRFAIKKASSIIISILFFAAAFLSLGLILIDLFINPLKLWQIWICVAVLVLLAVLFFLRKKKKKVLTAIYAACIFVISAVLLFYAYCTPFWNNLYFSQNYSYTVSYNCDIPIEQAIDDVNEFMKLLKRYHPAFIKEIPEETSESYDTVMSYFSGKDSVKEYELQRCIENIASTVHDAHTNASILSENEYYINDLAYRSVNGWKLIGVNGKNLDEIFNDYRNYYSFEAESWGIYSLKQNLISLSGLAYLGIDSADFSIIWGKDGIYETVEYGLDDFIPASEYTKLYQNLKSDVPTEWISYTADREKDIAILVLNECNYNSELKQKYADFFTEVKENNIKNVVVDLRKNGGGNSSVANEFIRYLPADSFLGCGCQTRYGFFLSGSNQSSKIPVKKYDALTFTGNVYILTSNSTFSSAVMFAEYIKDNNLGVIIGETPGNSVNAYGDISVHQLKNSKIVVSISTKIFTRPSGDLTDDYITPDYECKSDDALNMVLELIGNKED